MVLSKNPGFRELEMLVLMLDTVSFYVRTVRSDDPELEGQLERIRDYLTELRDYIDEQYDL